MNARRQRWLYHAARLLLGGVFCWAGAVKAVDPLAFARAVSGYLLLPHVGNLLTAATLPYVELLAGGLLLINRRVRPALLLVGALNLIFIVALVSAIVRGLNIDCGCFRNDGSATPPELALLRDLGLLGVTLLCWRLSREAARRS